ncbi:MAG: hypothetical protein Q9N67_03225 [Ghiorsea sp.]|nr:hypothetical protein [Ghiorsea sp.]
MDKHNRWIEKGVTTLIKHYEQNYENNVSSDNMMISVVLSDLTPLQAHHVKDKFAHWLLGKNYTLPPIIKKHLQDMIDGKSKPKVNKGKERHRNARHAEMVALLVKTCGMTATRNDASLHNSACDFVAYKFGLSFETVKKAWEENKSLRECDFKEALKFKAELEADGYKFP